MIRYKTKHFEMDFIHAKTKDTLSLKTVYNIDNYPKLNIPQKINGKYTVVSLLSKCFDHLKYTINHINIPKSLYYIDEYVFYDLYNLKEINYNKKTGISYNYDLLPYIAMNAFYNCNNLIKISLPETFKTISYNSFVNLNNLKYLILNSDLYDSSIFRYIDNQIYSIPLIDNCPNIKAVIINKNLLIKYNKSGYNIIDII